MKDSEFFIPAISEYYLLFKYNYTVPQLKQICKKYKIPRSGGKENLMQYAYNFLFFSHHAVKLQKYVRGFLQRKLNKIRGPAFLDRKLCVNDSDFFSLEPISDIMANQFFSFKDKDGFIYGFDILSLWQLFEKKQEAENPYNRQKIPIEIYAKLKYLIKLNKKKGSQIETSLVNNNLDRDKELELRILSLFQFINSLGHYTNHSWFMDLQNQQLVRFYRELYDIWNHRAQIGEDIKYNIYPRGNPFRTGYNMPSSLDSIYDLRKNCVQVCENLVFHGVTVDDKTLGAYYILTALTLQSHEAAVALPWLYQSVAQS